jgi:hypothetical protein
MRRSMNGEGAFVAATDRAGSSIQGPADGSAGMQLSAKCAGKET